MELPRLAAICVIPDAMMGRKMPDIKSSESERGSAMYDLLVAKHGTGRSFADIPTAKREA